MPKAIMLWEPAQSGDARWLPLHLEAGEVIQEVLQREGFEVEVTRTAEAATQPERLKELDLIVPVWEREMIPLQQWQPFAEAVQGGVGLAGVHYMMADSFYRVFAYPTMVGGQFIGHPGAGDEPYTVMIADPDHPITRGLSDFTVASEHYYMHVDPGNHVLATTLFGEVVMPVAWVKPYGEGRVFYSSLGHERASLEVPESHTMLARGLLWAARQPITA